MEMAGFTMCSIVNYVSPRIIEFFHSRTLLKSLHLSVDFGVMSFGSSFTNLPWIRFLTGKNDGFITLTGT